MKIEQKAEAYDEAIRKAKDMLTNKEVRQEDMEYLFPELKESEDERIRKRLCAVINDIGGNVLRPYLLTKDKVLAWLEKQVSIDENEVAKCVLNEVANSIMRWLDANLAEGNMCLSNMECEDIENAVRNANWQKIYGYMKKKLEKQDNFSAKWEKNIANNKPALNHSVLMKNIYGIAEGEWNGKEWIQYRWSSKIKDSDVLYWMNLYELEKQGKHTQGNTALEAVREEKVDSQNCVNPAYEVGGWVVDEDDNHAYQIVRVIENVTSDKISYIPFTKKNYHLWTIQDAKDGDVLVDVYGNIGIFEKYDDFDWTSYCFSWKSGSFCHFKADHENEKTYPATQEQRDTLFKAMTDAGYTFNFKKKKLEKIEQNPTWSVEDEANFQCVLERINNNPLLEDVNVENYKCWLQSLKQRCTWKPSEGQMDALAWALSLAKNCGEECAFDLRTLHEQLEKLK